jgi:hypothetical protein
MQYINTETGEDDLSELFVREQFPNISFGPADFPPAPFAERLETAQPSFNPLTQDVVRAPSALIGGAWRQVWSVVDCSAEEAARRAKATVPSAVTMRQARLVLLGAGLLDRVNAAIASMPSPQKEAAQIEWEYSGEVQRNKPLVLALGPALGLSDAQLDAMFVAASKL